MKVADINNISSDTQKKYTVDNKQTDTDKDRTFHRQITTVNHVQYQKHIKDLQNRITQQGEVIKRKADIKEIQQYRKLITELLNETVSNSYDCSKSNAFDGRGKHKVFVIIRNVNKKLEELTKEILADQTDNLNFLEMVDDIRGLLVDLFL